ncbi:MAG: preprotein translocase subunit SecA [Acidobacteria bacterium]|nr:preprotein translocase subunit SecA [Acidobacteriota bacterium]
MLKTLTKVFGSKNERELKKIWPMAQKINDLEPEFQKLSDEALKAKTEEFRARLEQGETLDDLAFEAFATVREASVRVLGMRHFDVQLVGGIILHRGAIAEMKTGEGKTLTATAPVYLNALPARGVHVVTVNDYLAKRDSEWMGQIYKFLGMSVGVILHGMDDDARREAYACDITYGTNNEMGFDYLRDNMKFTPNGCVHRHFHYAIVDEVDSVLIDEARTPLIISGASDESTEKYQIADGIIRRLRESHYTVDEKDRQALFTEEGVAFMERALNIQNLYDPDNLEILHCLEQSLKSHHLFKFEVDYLVNDNQVIIIDQHTGRLMPGRRYSDGLHQALEAKEGVKIERQSQTLASVTFQNYFRMYEKLSGMTGTAETEAAEFLKIYDLEVYVAPTNKPLRRDDFHDQIYRSAKEKFDAILNEIERLHATGRPVLVGTIAVETSEMLSHMLTKRGVKHIVLNAKHHERESEIVAQAGRLNAVTIATNMAGRGTDIILGGNPEMLARTDASNDPEADMDQLIEKYRKICAAEKEKVLELGGLAIIGTERHDARRIDNQLRGRSGRQGDPGSTRFFLCLEDNLMRLFGNPRLKAWMAKSMQEGEPIEHRWVTKSIERAQKAVEARNFDARKHLLEYDDVMNKQRTTFYRLRRDILEKEPRPYLYSRMEAIAGYMVESHMTTSEDKSEQLERLKEAAKHQFFFQPEDDFDNLSQADMTKAIVDYAKQIYEAKWAGLELSDEEIESQERFLMLYFIDQQWKTHMRNMDYLKEGISLQGYAQKDPLIEYKKQSYEMFNELMDLMDEEVVRMLILLKPRLNDDAVNRMRQRRAREAKEMREAGREDAKPKTVRRDQPKIGRNEPCHCGSGRKFKHCHGRR